MNKIPETGWVSQWIYRNLLDENNNEIIGGKFFVYQDEALWRCANQLGVLHNDLNPIADNLKIIDRLTDILYNGDWISQMAAMANIESINCFDPEYVTYIRWVSSDDCTYEIWIVGREDYWTEQGFDAVKRYAKFSEWRLDHYGEIPAASVDREGNAFFQSNGNSSRSDQSVFDNPFDINDYQHGYEVIKNENKPSVVPIEPIPSTPVNNKSLPHPNQAPLMPIPNPVSSISTKDEIKSVKKKKVKGSTQKTQKAQEVQQTLF